ncbi:MAG: benzoyl-CoA 2,3-epoxidase subunit BoxA [Myxococcales bacterium]|jgi:benzoyl-CoA 2,3-dioxygenase component A|nr:benzoyl-CoA 2,3-epoxidase subunit BoxA [Myxococcales bacterium]
MTALPLVRQHLIDPEICIRCNTCEETCPTGAITHDRRNYVVKHELCNECGDCLPPCPTGAIDSWRRVEAPFPIDQQLVWDSLPADAAPPAPVDGASEVPDDVLRLSEIASAAEGGRVPPPWSAAHPYVGLYSLEKPAIATVAGVHRLTAEDAESDIRHIVLDFGKTAMPVLEGQSIGVVPPGVDPETGKPHHVRLYSVASPRNGERPGHNNLALTVKRVVVDRDGKPTRGVASSYLCDLQKGDKVTVTGPYGSTFLMPNHPGAKLLMICTGTGAAPMRAMTERRRRRMGLGEGGEIMLFFGARRPEELPYFGPLMKLPKELIRVELAFSRVPGKPKEYVQDRIRASADAVRAMLTSDDTFVFVCGHKKMEEGVLAALGDVCKDGGTSFADLKDRMRREGRLHIETY